MECVRWPEGKQRVCVGCFVRCVLCSGGVVGYSFF